VRQCGPNLCGDVVRSICCVQQGFCPRSYIAFAVQKQVSDFLTQLCSAGLKGAKYFFALSD
jgi:hypothetical protein